MKKALIICVFLAFLAGCHTDIVTTKQLKAVNPKCVYIGRIDSEDPYVGRVIQDVLKKEFIRKKVQLCDADAATIILTGSTFLTTRSTGKTDWFGSKESSAESIESMTVTAKDPNGNILLTASYDNVEQFTASKLSQEFGSALANKLK